MRKIFFILVLSFIYTISFSQSKSNDSNKRTYYAMADPQYAIIKKLNNGNGKVEEINIGRYPSITIDNEKRTLILKTQLIPDLTKNKDSALLLYTQHAFVTIAYSIVKNIAKNELPQYGTEGYIIQPFEDSTKRYVFLATSKTQSNFCDNVYFLFQDDNSYFTSLDIPLMMWDN